MKIHFIHHRFTELLVFTYNGRYSDIFTIDLTHLEPESSSSSRASRHLHF